MPLEKRVLMLICLLALATIVPFLATIFTQAYLADWRWHNVSLHSSIEAFGAYTAFVFATVLILQRKYLHPPARLWLAASLLATGVFDFLHAIVMGRPDSVLLRVAAAVFGAIIMALVWLPEKVTERRLASRLPLAIILFSLSVGLFMMIFHSFFPPMIIGQTYTHLADSLNVVAGLLFLAAAVKFAVLYARTDSAEYVFFLTLTLLFAAAAFLFPFSRVWDPAWWLWHAFRAAGYCIALVLVFISFQQTQTDLNKTREKLEERVKARTREAEEAKLMAEAANRSKSEFLANVSHELRNPLNSIIGFSELLSTGVVGRVSGEQKKYLEDIRESGARLLRLINEILDLSKIEAGEVSLELGEVDVRKLMETCAVMFSERATRHNIAISYRVGEGATEVFADFKKLKQVLYNLISNAIKFTPDGGRVSVESGRVVINERNFIEVKVTDTGIGIAEEDFDRLFKPFQQLEPTLTKQHPGAGLGLNLCKRLVELHGGRIWVESKKNTGSTFAFTIPLDISPR